jgi:hypothetical protein
MTQMRLFPAAVSGSGPWRSILTRSCGKPTYSCFRGVVLPPGPVIVAELTCQTCASHRTDILTHPGPREVVM